MSDNSRIEWTDATWNFVVGCTKVSPGCDHCYAERDVNRWNGDGAFDTVVLKPEKLDLPLHWRRPRRIFVNSLSDLFHDAIPDEFVAHAFAVMATAGQHTYQILTKRHARMRSLLSDSGFRALVDGITGDYIGRPPARPQHLDLERGGVVWPLPNVWLGVSVEDQKWADIRIPALLETPAVVRFLSCEPLLGPLSLAEYVNPARRVPGCTCAGTAPGYPQHESYCGWEPDEDAARPDWVIVGGESGPGARPMAAEWARALRDECLAGDVAFHFKQWGQHDEYGRRRRSKREAGRVLDGATHDAMPVPDAMPDGQLLLETT